jgi:deazaflavin-dependent oxidoreductase (nitroreductase family)
MPKSIVDFDPSHGLLRFGVRLPILLYRMHLGWLLGDRFLMLTHTGRKSGLPRHVVLEVVRHDRRTGEYMIASGWRGKSDWFRNIQKTPQVTVNVGGRQFKARASQISVEEAETALLDYAHSHPLAFRELAGLISGREFNSKEEICNLMAQEVPLITLKPESGLAPES